MKTIDEITTTWVGIYESLKELHMERGFIHNDTLTSEEIIKLFYLIDTKAMYLEEELQNLITDLVNYIQIHE